MIRTSYMAKTKPAISDLFRVPNRFLRSAHLERDFLDVAALDDYVLTPPMADAFMRIADGLKAASGRRAWRITGDYGVGKSSFALVLAHLFGSRSANAAGRIADLLGWPATVGGTAPVLLPVLLTGAREGLVPALARGIGDALSRRQSPKGRKTRAHTVLVEQAAAAEISGELADLERLVEALREQAAADGMGVLLIVDELGKLLEHAAQRPDREDVFALQRLAEIAARSGDRPFLLLGLLHQGFQAYAERLPFAARHEWDKVAGRFDEIVFDQPLVHTAALVAGALNVQPGRLPPAIRAAAGAAAEAAGTTGWLVGGSTRAASVDVGHFYPLHPTLLPVLVRFFGRFGQHERSLFGFLLSSEPFGLQAFATRPMAADAWYGVAEFYDYVRAGFGHRLAGASYRNQWLRILATVDAASDLSPLELRVLKAIAVLNLIDADDLLPTREAVQAIFAPAVTADLGAAIAQLKRRGLLFQRGTSGPYRLWPNGSVRLDAALDAAIRAVGPVETVAAGLEAHLDHEPILARRHYVEYGTLRYFERRYVHAPALSDVLAKPSEADGVVVVVLADNEAEQVAALRLATGSPFTERPDVVVGIVQPLLGLAPELQDVRCWKWVEENTPELAEDVYASAEVARQLATARRALAGRLETHLGFRDITATGVQWFRAGVAVTALRRGGLSALLSEVCNELYPSAPLITNELLNRNALSSAAAAARMRLIEGLFNAGDRPFLGLSPDKAPPEKSMYLSILKKGAVHVETDGQFEIVEPAEEDPLRLRPAIERLIEVIEAAHGDRVPALKLLDGLRERPFGVRGGVAPLLLAIVLRTRAHELAVYEHGTFLHRFGPSDFLRLTKAPATFEIQHCRVAGVRLEVFAKLAAAFVSAPTKRPPDLLDVVRPLCQFAAQLPEYTRRTSALGSEAVAVREALLSAQEPSTMLFRDLPEACGVGAFTSDQTSDSSRVKRFVTTLHEAIGELRGAYPKLLSRIIARVADALDEEHDAFDRARLARRAARVSLAAREPRLRTFALRLRDPGLSDEAWAEALASFIVARPPARWASGDEARFSEEVGTLSELFYKVEATAFHNDADPPAIEAIRLNLTRGDGEDLVRVIEPQPEDSDLQQQAELLRGRLPQDRNFRIQVLTQLLWAELKAVPDGGARDGAKTDTPSIKRRR
jgi:hypothetical protein